MLRLDRNAEPECVIHLLEAGDEANLPADAFGQSLAHMAASGGQACLLLWQLQTGVNFNQQDWLGEAPIHKAAKAGSLECLALLVASHASIDLRNKNGQTAEDLAQDFGFLECVQFLMTVKHIKNMSPTNPFSYTLHDNSGSLRDIPASQKRAYESRRPVSKKRMTSDGIFSLR